MGIFGWDYPPGCTGTPADEPSGPCEVCGRDVDSDACICPECPECGEQGNPACYVSHGMVVSREQADSREELERIWAAGAEAEAKATEAWAAEETTMNDADLCRRNGWTPGTVLEGRESCPDGPWAESRIRITSVGEEGILARELARRAGHTHGWIEGNPGEHRWTLGAREWRAVEAHNGA